MARNPARKLRGCQADAVEDYRDLIEEESVPETTHITGVKEAVELRRQFFPTDKLRDILSIDVVKEILNHECENCQNHLSGARQAHPSQYPAERILATDAAVNIFALLILLRYPLLIGCFLSFYDDTALPDPRFFSPYDLRDRQFKHLQFDRSREVLLAQFQTEKWRFSVPSFNDSSFQIYEKGTILPYLDEQPIDRGGFGKVFKVTVHPLYCRIGPIAASNETDRSFTPKIFARKEIIGQDAIDFINERMNLEKIATLKHPNLVQIQKTYQLGNRFNILFPFAKTNLHHWLRNKTWRAPQAIKISRSPLWDQVLGITEALSRIISFADPEDPEHIIFGYHLDLKPSNILIDRETTAARDVFKITDFGQTQFLEPAFAGTGRTTRVIGGGGTDAYAPPEFLKLEKNRAYDVWSLGIIVLEVLAFAIKGTEGLTHDQTGLDQVRHTREEGGSNSRFYTFQGAEAVVKPIILNWIDALLRDPFVSDPESREFVKKLQELILDMLEPQMSQRISIDKVLSRMQKLFDVVISDHIEENAAALRQPDERILVDERQIDYYPRGVFKRQSVRSSFIMLEDSKHRLRTFVGNHVRQACNQRQDMKMIAAFQHTHVVENAQFELSFSAVKEESAISLQDMSFVVDDETFASRLQMALTSHTISPRCRVEGMKLVRYSPPFEKTAALVKASTRKIFRSSSDTVPALPKPDEGDPCPLWIEVWIEQPHLVPVPPVTSTKPPDATGTGRRLNRQSNPARSVPLGRVVLYCKDRIYIIPFAKESQLRKQEHMAQNKIREITFEPMDRKQCDYFRMYCLRKTHNDVLPGIPMYHAALYAAEKENQFLCETLTVKFDKWEDAVNMYRLYKNEKARWLHFIKGEQPSHPSMLVAA